MPLTRSTSTASIPERPSFWFIAGHSYIQTISGTWDVANRMDFVFSNALGVPLENRQNIGVNGSKFSYSSMTNGGWPAFFYEQIPRPTRGSAPYSASGGAALIVAGINDVGHLTNTTQARTAYVGAMRACISRFRAGRIYVNNSGAIAYGAGFVQITTGVDGYSSQGFLRRATTTTNATITITIAADYTGETIAVAFIGKPGTGSGGVVTITSSGTISGLSGHGGATNTIDTSNVMPGAAPTGNTNYTVATNGHCVVVKRFRLNTTGTTQTVTMTVTSVGASTPNVDFDTAWLEAKYGNPVIVANIARLPLGTGGTGQTNYAAWTNANPTEAGRDADVVAWNTAIADMINTEFDSMVQIADIDAALGKDATLFGPDLVHPNDYGAPKCADALVAAVRRLSVPNPLVGRSNYLQNASPAPGSVRRRRNPGNVYTTQGNWSGTGYTLVSGDMFAIPFEVSETGGRYDQLSVNTNATVPAGTHTLLTGVYAQQPNNSYPGRNVANWSTLSITAAANTAHVRSLTWEPDPGVYWLVIRVIAVGTTVAGLWCMSGYNPHMTQMTNNTGAVVTAAATGTLTGLACGYKITGQGTATTWPAVFPATANLVSTVPVLGLRAAAAG